MNDYVQRWSRILLVIMVICGAAAALCRNAFAAQPEEFSDICRALSLVSAIDRSTRAAKFLDEALQSSKSSMIRDAIWSGTDPRWLMHTRWYSYAQHERLNVLLLAAVAKDRLEQVRSLLKKGADPNVDGQQDYRMTPVITAARCASAEVMRTLLRAGGDVNARVEYGTDGGATFKNSTALRWAAERGDLQIVEILLKAGADPNIQEVVCGKYDCSLNNRPGDSAVLVNPVFPVLSELLAAGARPNVANWAGRTPLMIAAEHGSIDECRLLLKFGADKDAKDVDGKTAADLAVAEGYNFANEINAWVYANRPKP